MSKMRNSPHDFLISSQLCARLFFEPFKDNCKVAVEATGYWYWLVDLLQELNLEVFLANPLQTKAIAYARVKNDKVDAETLTHLLKANLLPTCWIPDKEQRTDRDMLRARARLVMIRTLCKNIVRSNLAKFNIVLPFTNIWEGPGRESLENVCFPPVVGEFIKQMLVHIDHLTQQIDYWEEKINEKIRLSESAQRLLTVLGVGKIWALTILYETGPIARFPRARRLCGLCGFGAEDQGQCG